MFMILAIVSGKERSDNPVPATSGEARPWADAELKVQSAKLKIKNAKTAKKPFKKRMRDARYRTQDLCFMF